MDRILARPWVVVVVIAAITVFFAAWLPRTVLDNNTFRFIPEHSRTRMDLVEANEIFGDQTPILIGLRRKHGSILEKEFLLKLGELTRRAEVFERVSEVTSLVSADYITGDSQSIRVEPLVPDDFDGSAAQIEALKTRLLEWEVYRRAFVSDDFTSTQLVVALDIDPDDAGSVDIVRMYHDLKRLTHEMDFPDTEIYLTGLPAFASVINEATRTDLVFLIPLVVGAVLLVLFPSFRRLGGIVLPMLTVLISTIWSVGAMALFGVKLSLVATVLPVILVAVGSAYGIHVINHYYDLMSARTNLDREGHRQVLIAALRRVARPVFLAAITTFAGFGSLCFTSVLPIREFGIFASFGVLVAFGVAVTLIPALLTIKGPPAHGKNLPGKAEDDAHLEADVVSRGVANVFGAVARRPVLVLGVSGLALVGGLLSSRLVVMDNVIVEYFKPDTDIARSDVFIREVFGGSKSISVIVGSEDRGAVLDPSVLTAMDRLDTYLSTSFPEVGKVTGYHQLIKRMNQVFNVDEPATGLVRRLPAARTPEPGADADFGFADFNPAAPAVEVLPAVAGPSEGVDGDGGGIGLKEAMALVERALVGTGEQTPDVREVVRQLYRQTNYRGAAYYEIPADPARYGLETAEELRILISNYLVLLSGGTDTWADDPLEPRAIRMNVQVRTVGQVDTRRLVNEVRDYIAAVFPDTVTVGIAGEALVEGELNDLVVRSQVTSLVTSLVLIFAILGISYRSVTAGLIGIVPLSLAVVLNFAVMGLAGITLNIGTAMVASVGIGTGVDYTVHYLSAYHHECLAGVTGQRLLRRTFLTSGKAIIFNAVSVGLGFAVLMLSQFNILAFLGALIALTMATSSLASLVVLPALLSVVRPKFINRPLPYERAGTEVVE